MAGAAIGGTLGAFGGPVGAAVGACLGGIIGGVAGGWSGGKLVDWADRKWNWSEKAEEEEGRAKAIVEAMVFLDTPNIDQLDTGVIYRCFRRKTLLHHPDKLPPSATEANRAAANINFVTLVMARDLLIHVMDHPNHLTSCFHAKRLGFLGISRKGLYLEKHI